MSAASSPRLRTFAFGDLDAGLWGIAVASIDGGQAAAHVGAIDSSTPASGAASLDGVGNDEPWRLTAPGIEVTLDPTGDALPLLGVPDGAQATMQLCRAHGQLLVDGRERELDCLAQRGTRSSDVDLDGIESLRDLTAWFGPDEGFALVAVRPRRAAAHDRDLITSAVLEEGSRLPIDEPRLSTAYSAAGMPVRASLELWLEEPAEDSEPEDPDAAAARSFPRRAAGEAVGPTATLAIAGLQVHAELFRWHLRGLDGAGVYALARPG